MPAKSQEQASWHIGKLEGAIDFDGKADEAAWDEVNPFPMITHLPLFGNTPTEKSDIRLGYNDQYVYVGASLYVSDPSLIQAIGKKRDMEVMSSDFLMLSLDTYNDKENSLVFATNPLGMRWDAAISNDGTMTMDQMPISSM